MKYTFTGKSLEEVVENTFRSALERKYVNESATISAGRAQYSYEVFYLDVIEGQRIYVAWDADDPSDGDHYAIDISSNSGHHRDSFSDSGRWSFSVNSTGVLALTVGVSYSPGYFLSAPGVAITISG